MSKILGHYDVHKSTLISQSDPDFRLVIRSRSNPTPYKPVHFILRPIPGGTAEYLSSMFPLTGGPYSGREAYSMDFAGEYLVVEVDRTAGTAIIRRRQPGEYSLGADKRAVHPGEKTARARGKHRSRRQRTSKIADNQ